METERTNSEQPNQSVVVVVAEANEYDGSAERLEELRSDDEPELKRLARLTPIEYDRERNEAAKTLGIRSKTLDEEISARRPPAVKEDSKSVIDMDLEPWPDDVDGSTLADSIRHAYSRFLATDQNSLIANSLWVLHCHCHAASYISPLLAYVSPEKRCGKTTALSITQRLVPRALPASNITSAALFRAVEKFQPTLLIDEADTFLRDSDELRGILNSGHNRDGAWVIRTVGEDHEPMRFATWAPKAVALIGRLPATLEDRAIEIQMRRRRPDERVEKFRGDRDFGLRDINRQAAKWASDHMDSLRERDPALPDELHDRAADNWRALVAIADELGGTWPDAAREAAKALTRSDTESTPRIQLLEDVRTIFSEPIHRDRVSSSDLCHRLAGMEDRPWAEWGRSSKPITPTALAKNLRPFEIRPKQMRFGSESMKGYVYEDFADEWLRYLEPFVPANQTETPKPMNESKALEANATETHLPNVSVRKPSNPSELHGCFDVSVGNLGDGDYEEGSA